MSQGIQESCPVTLTAVEALPCGLELGLWGPIFPDFDQDQSLWSIQLWLLRIFGVLVDTPQAIILVELPIGHGIRLECLSLWIKEEVTDINKRSPIQHLIRTKTNLFLRSGTGMEENYWYSLFPSQVGLLGYLFLLLILRIGWLFLLLLNTEASSDNGDNK